MNARLIQPNELASHQTAPAVVTHNVGISLEERSRQIAQGDFGKKLHLDQSSHPMACFFSFAIKAFGAVTYLFYSWILDGYLSAFMYTVIIYAIDFWVMKNLIGRSLMGLRWWTVNLEDGTEKWVYESKEEEYHPNKVDYYFFWGSMVVGLLFWGIFGFFNILSLRLTWAVINIICLGLIGMNFYAFLKCSKEYQAKMKTLKKALGNPTAQAGVTAMVNKYMQA